MQSKGESSVISQLTERISRARTREDWVAVCVFFLQEIAQKNHPQTHDWGREIDFFLQHISSDSDEIWEKAHQIARKQKRA